MVPTQLPAAMSRRDWFFYLPELGQPMLDSDCTRACPFNGLPSQGATGLQVLLTFSRCCLSRYTFPTTEGLRGGMRHPEWCPMFSNVPWRSVGRVGFCFSVLCFVMFCMRSAPCSPCFATYLSQLEMNAKKCRGKKWNTTAFVYMTEARDQRTLTQKDEISC